MNHDYTRSPVNKEARTVTSQKDVSDSFMVTRERLIETKLRLIERRKALAQIMGIRKRDVKRIRQRYLQGRLPQNSTLDEWILIGTQISQIDNELEMIRKTKKIITTGIKLS